MILRSAELYDHHVVVHDPSGLMMDERLSTVADFACGALGRCPPSVSTTFDGALDASQGRIVATGFDDNSIPLDQYTWKEGDCILLGNEYDGLPDEVRSKADLRVWVPTLPKSLPKPSSISPIEPSRVEEVRNNGSASLNVAATAVLIMYHVFLQRDRML